MSKVGDYPVPFDKHGNLLHYPDSYHTEEWRKNEPFRASVFLNKAVRGRSATYFIWKDSLGHEYPMFQSDTYDLIMRGDIKKGAVYGAVWTVVKKGSNYGLKLHKNQSIL